MNRLVKIDLLARHWCSSGWVYSLTNVWLAPHCLVESNNCFCFCLSSWIYHVGPVARYILWLVAVASILLDTFWYHTNIYTQLYQPLLAPLDGIAYLKPQPFGAHNTIAIWLLVTDGYGIPLIPIRLKRAADLTELGLGTKALISCSKRRRCSTVFSFPTAPLRGPQAARRSDKRRAPYKAAASKGLRNESQRWDAMRCDGSCESFLPFSSLYLRSLNRKNIFTERYQATRSPEFQSCKSSRKLTANSWWCLYQHELGCDGLSICDIPSTSNSIWSLLK